MARCKQPNKRNKPCLHSSNKPHNCVCVGNHKLFNYANTASTKKKDGKHRGTFFQRDSSFDEVFRSCVTTCWMRDRCPTVNYPVCEETKTHLQQAFGGLTVKFSVLPSAAFLRCKSAFKCLDTILKGLHEGYNTN